MTTIDELLAQVTALEAESAKTSSASTPPAAGAVPAPVPGAGGLVIPPSQPTASGERPGIGLRFGGSNPDQTAPTGLEPAEATPGPSGVPAPTMSPGSAMGEPTVDSLLADIEALEKPAVDPKIAAQDPIDNYLAGANKTLAGILGLPRDIPVDVLKELGESLLGLPETEKRVGAKSMEYLFNAAGIKTQYPPGSQAAEMGSETVKGLVSAAAMIAAAPAAIARGGSSIITKVAETIRNHPYMTMFQELGAAPGGVAAGDLVSPDAPAGVRETAQIAGSMAGGAAATMAKQAVQLPIRGVSKLAEGAMRLVDRMRPAGSQPYVPGKSGAPLPTTPLRDPLAQPQTATHYADFQIEGDKQTVQAALSQAIESVQRTPILVRSGPRQGQPALDRNGNPRYNDELTLQGRVRSDLENAKNIGRRLERSYWSRTDLRQPVPGSGILREIDTIDAQLKSSNSPISEYPGDAIKAIYHTFAPAQGLPSIAQVRKLVSDIDHLRSVNLAKDAPNGALNRTYAQLEDVLHTGMREAYPNDVAIQQASSYSQWFNDVFHRSPVGDALAVGRSGRPSVDPGQTVDYLKSQFGGLKSALQISKELATDPPNAYAPSATPREKTRLTALRENIENTLREQFRSAAGDDPMEAAKFIRQNEGKIRDVARVSAQLETVGGELAKQQDLRKTIEQSALHKFSKQDPQPGIASIFNNQNPAKTASDLVKTLQGDPSAIEGFRAGIIDELAKRTKLDPLRMKGLLEEPKIRRMMEVALPPDQLARLDKMVDIAARIDAGDVQTFGQKYSQGLVMLGRIFAVKAHALLPNLGTGGNIQIPGMFSQMAKTSITKALSGIPGEDLLKNAIRDPSWERLILAKEPVDTKDLDALLRLTMRVVRAEEGIRQSIFDRPESVPAEGQRQRIMPSDEVKADFNQSLFGPASNVRTNPEALEAMPTSTNVEDRRFMTSPRNPFTSAGGMDRQGAFVPEGRSALRNKIEKMMERSTEENDSRHPFYAVAKPISPDLKPGRLEGGGGLGKGSGGSISETASITQNRYRGYGGQGKTKWWPTDVKLIGQMRRDGASTAEMIEALDGRHGKNAVLGKLHQMGLSKSQSPILRNRSR